MVAALPVLFADPALDWDGFHEGPGTRAEFLVGRHFLEANGRRSLFFFVLARWACVPFSVLGAYVCYRWARELYGDAAGMIALVLWSTCPNIVGHGALITPDVGATALGVAAAYTFWRWIRLPDWGRATMAAIALGRTYRH
jgi:hypothetical protein